MILSLLLPLAILHLWTLFLSYSALKVTWNSLCLEVKIIGLVIVIYGFFVDVAINWTLGLLLGVTSDWTLSSKCGKLIRTLSKESIRRKVAIYLCANWLDPFEIGGHCRGN